MRLNSEKQKRIQVLRKKWKEFKHLRTRPLYCEEEFSGYLTPIQREEIIEELFKILD